MAFTEGMIYDASGQLCAHSTGTFKYVKRAPANSPETAKGTIATD